jgi:hypothetical protein
MVPIKTLTISTCNGSQTESLSLAPRNIRTKNLPPYGIATTSNVCKNRLNLNHEGCSSTGQTLGLLPRGHQFESHKPQDYWRLTWSLTSGSVGLVEVRTSWPRYSC